MALFVCVAINNNKANSDQHDAIYRSKIVLDAKPKRFGWVSKQRNRKTYYQVQYIKSMEGQLAVIDMNGHSRTSSCNFLVYFRKDNCYKIF